MKPQINISLGLLVEIFLYICGLLLENDEYTTDTDNGEAATHHTGRFARIRFAGHRSGELPRVCVVDVPFGG